MGPLHDILALQRTAAIHTFSKAAHFPDGQRTRPTVRRRGSQEWEQSRAPASRVSPASQQRRPGDPPPTANAGFPSETNVCLPTSHADCLPRGGAQKGFCFSSSLPGELRRCAWAGLHAPPTRHGAPRGRSVRLGLERHGHSHTGPRPHPQGHHLTPPCPLPQAPLKAVCMPAPTQSHPALSSPPQSGLGSEPLRRKSGQTQPHPGVWLPPALS